MRKLFPVWRNLPSLADPEWLVDEALEHIDSASERPYAGLVFFSTAHFPYAAPYPYYLRDSADYEGPYLYHVPPEQAGKELGAEDIRQLRARYDGALAAIDGAMNRLKREAGLARGEANRIVVITGDHGEELYEIPGIGGHGDIAHSIGSQAVPILLEGPGVPAGEVSSAQVRLYDLGATILELTLGERSATAPAYRFGDGVSLAEGQPRPICVETGIWFWPMLPVGLDGHRLDYLGISELLELLPTREMALRSNMESLVETSKERGLVQGHLMWRERLTPRGLHRSLDELALIERGSEPMELESQFEKRCVDGDPKLSRVLGTVVYGRETHYVSTNEN